jgi:hypothetical protein
MNEHANSNMKDELEDLQNPEHWDYERAERRPAAKAGRAVVSVAFPRDDFQLVANAADREGERLSEFVRKAAVARARDQEPRPALASVSGGGYGIALYADRPVSASGASGVVINSSGFSMRSAMSPETQLVSA